MLPGDEVVAARDDVSIDSGFFDDSSGETAPEGIEFTRFISTFV